MIIRSIKASRYLHLYLFLLACTFSISAQGIPAGAMLDAPAASSEQTQQELLPPAGDTPVKLTGTPAILISRPVFAPYTNEENTMFIAAISQGYFHFKFSSLSGVQVISPEKMASSIPYFRDYTRRISRNAYIESARRLGASYLFYQEYEPQGKKVRYNIELYSLIENKRLVSKSMTLALQEFEKGLEECSQEVVAALPAQTSDYTREFLTTPVLGDNQKAIETFGNAVASIGDYSEKRAAAQIDNLSKVINSNQKFHVAKYLAASVCAAANNYSKAIDYQNDLITIFGVSNPSLYLELASYYKASGSYDQALDATDQAAKEPSLKFQVLSERASICEAQGNLKKAQSYYEEILAEGTENGSTYFKLALVNIGLNDLNGASAYLSKAESAGYRLDRGSYYDLGLRYCALGNANDKAIEAFKNSLGVAQDYEPAWQQLAKLYMNMGRKADAAECYVNLFKINNATYKEDLLMAAEIYEELNETEKVKDAYSLFLARKFVDYNVSVKLAKLEVASGNCDKATDLVFRLDTISAVAEDVRAINQQCGKTERRVTIPTGNETKKRSPGITIWRIASAVLAIGGAGAGYYFDTQVADKQKKYDKSYDLNEIRTLHTEIDDAMLYRTLCYAGAGVGAVSLAVSITLPIIFSDK